ncbi:thioesterase II family protein [Streptomyces triticiradicis]|uniref:Thioesterase n=1 Tax=Streptomyces triticiradicis TaxID=2651189 RepID=A0A7J5D2E5_9ACTN|nr:alpha/beta fold hydrolase [Streptomyces triticiradicis]KAB1977597.1 thioesterase [Streptomyces triticiradicis]
MPMPGTDAARWLRRFRPNASARVRLVCFPHAGGSASFYHPVAMTHAAAADVVVLQYPGRQDRRHEPLVPSVAEYVARIGPVLEQERPLPTVHFGHSMGAVLAFETAIALADTPAAPRAIVASGRRAPATYRDERVHLRDDEGLLDELRKLNGTQADLLGDEEIVRMALPAVRGDYRVIETYQAVRGSTVDCPITVLVGDDDPKTTVAEADRWREHSTAAFRLRTFPGGHFYLAEHQAAVNAELAATLSAVSAGAAVR